MSHAHAELLGADTRRAGLDIADVFRIAGEKACASFYFSPAQRVVMRRILKCRTIAMGGHLDACDHCGFQQPAYNSCRDRHCPKCQATRQALWVAQRAMRFLPTGHFHVVFTVPGLLRPRFKQHPARLFDALFEAVAKTIKAFASDPKWLGAQIGMTAVLHTWTRDLRYHPHLHCIITHGGLAADGQHWVKGRAGPAFLFPTNALAKVFRAKLLAIIRRDHDAELARQGLPNDIAFDRFIDRLFRMKWVVYAKAPFSNAKHLLAYLGQYTHRVAISNHRLIAIGDEHVTFATKNGLTHTLDAVEFVRRFLDHVLPEGFVKIRHYGLYAATHINGRLELARARLAPNPESSSPQPAQPSDTTTREPIHWREVITKLSGKDPLLCTQCRQGTMRHVQAILPEHARGPPSC
jgi:hypothetical protein